jgi:hypothetical protein
LTHRLASTNFRFPTMAFGKPFAQKPRKTVTPVRPMSGALVRIVVLGVLAVLGAAWGVYMYYTHAFHPRPRPAASAPASNEIEIELVPSPSASR